MIGFQYFFLKFLSSCGKIFHFLFDHFIELVDLRKHNNSRTTIFRSVLSGIVFN